MMMGADYYQTESEIASLLAEGKVPIGVGRNTKIRWEMRTKPYSPPPFRITSPLVPSYPHTMQHVDKQKGEYHT